MKILKQHSSFLFTLFLFVLSYASAAQHFSQPAEVPVFKRYCSIIRTDGVEIQGNIRAINLGRGGVRSITIITADNIKSKLFAADISSITFGGSGFGKALNVLARFESVEKVSATDFRQTLRDSVTFVRMAPFREKHYVGQLLNKSFSSRIRVFYAPMATKTSNVMRWIGGMNRAYLVEKNAKTIKVKKGNYRRLYDDLYADCPELIKLSRNERGFGKIEEHIFMYDTCESNEQN